MFTVPLGIYISVPFCRTKCSYCNFASDVFSKAAYENYVRRLIEDVGGSRRLAEDLGCVFDDEVDSVYLGGGTPSILDDEQLKSIFGAVREQFVVRRDAEVTVECAPGTLTPALIETLQECGVNRLSLGVQSFVDEEARAVGRLHKRATVLEEVARLRAVGMTNINIDLISGLPHQKAESWSFSLAEAIALGVPHVSVYMLEVDEDSRLGRELIAGGTRYHAHFVPDDGLMADFYTQACETLSGAGIGQYEISNFARAGMESKHNLKYWTRQPYLGFGVDAHSMLRAITISTSAAEADPQSYRQITALKRCATQNHGVVRSSTPDSLDGYMNRASGTATAVSPKAVLEEAFFLGLRLNRGIDLEQLKKEFSEAAIREKEPAIEECIGEGLLEERGETVRLTARGRLLSNEVFARFLSEEVKVGTGHVNPR